MKKRKPLSELRFVTSAVGITTMIENFCRDDKTFKIENDYKDFFYPIMDINNNVLLYFYWDEEEKSWAENEHSYSNISLNSLSFEGSSYFSYVSELDNMYIGQCDWDELKQLKRDTIRRSIGESINTPTFNCYEVYKTFIENTSSQGVVGTFDGPFTDKYLLLGVVSTDEDYYWLTVSLPFNKDSKVGLTSCVGNFSCSNDKLNLSLKDMTNITDMFIDSFKNDIYYPIALCDFLEKDINVKAVLLK
jgi:hypothetical protein